MHAALSFIHQASALLTRSHQRMFVRTTATLPNIICRWFAFCLGTQLYLHGVCECWLKHTFMSTLRERTTPTLHALCITCFTRWMSPSLSKAGYKAPMWSRTACLQCRVLCYSKLRINLIRCAPSSIPVHVVFKRSPNMPRHMLAGDEGGQTFRKKSLEVWIS